MDDNRGLTSMRNIFGVYSHSEKKILFSISILTLDFDLNLGLCLALLVP